MNEWTVLERPLRGPLAVTLTFGLCIGALLGWCAARWSLPMAGVTGLSALAAVMGVATAVGTIGAVFVTLRQWSWSQRSLDQERLRLGQIVAAKLSISLSPTIDVLKNAEKLFQKARENARQEPWTAKHDVKAGYALLEKLNFEVSLPEITALSTLDASAADAMAKAAGCLVRIKEACRSYSPTEDIMQLEEKDYFLAAGHCHLARRWLREARTACSAHSKRKYITPKAWIYSNKTLPPAAETPQQSGS